MAEDEFGLKEKVSKLPTTPGVYQFFDANGVIIYIGKAKNLKNRVSSYFVKTNQTSKTMVLVRKIRDLKYIVVNTEEDALLLENNLIKKYKPRYNILLKDDKTYPWICITKEAFPRVFTTRKFIRNGSEYFGPYTSAKYANTLISLIKSDVSCGNKYPSSFINTPLLVVELKTGQNTYFVQFLKILYQLKGGS